MAYTYYNLYKKYFDSLNGRNIVSVSNSLSESVTSYSNIINQHFNSIIESRWSESGANIVKGQLISSIKTMVKDLNILISEKLSKACNISMNNLLPTVILIEKEDTNLQNLKTELISLEGELQSLEQVFSHTSEYEIGKNRIRRYNSEYTRLASLINLKKGEINNKKCQITACLTTLQNLCNDANGYLAKIAALDNSNILIPSCSGLLSEDGQLSTLLSIESIKSNYDNFEIYSYTDRNGNKIDYSIINLKPLGLGTITEFTDYIKKLGLYNAVSDNETPHKAYSKLHLGMGMQCYNLSSFYASIILNAEGGKQKSIFLSACDEYDQLELNGQIPSDLSKVRLSSSEGLGKLIKNLTNIEKDKTYNNTDLYMDPFDAIGSAGDKHTVSEHLEIVKSQLDSGNPVLLRVSKSGGGQHWVLAVGYKTDAVGPLTEADVLYIDSYDGNLHQLGSKNRSRHLLSDDCMTRTYLGNGFETL